jgi:hypothetical protein
MVGIEMGSGDDASDALPRFRMEHFQGFFHRSASVIHAGQDVAVEIYTSAHGYACSLLAASWALL